MASSILLKFPRNTETVTTNAKNFDIKAALQRVQRPFDVNKISLEVYGVYSLPDLWKNAINTNDPNEALYSYELEIAGIKVQGAKALQRELTKEEKAAAEAAAAQGKGAKAPPPKGKPVEEKQPTAEELAAIEKEKIAREEAEARRLAEWAQLDEETKFFRTNEDPQKEVRIVLENKVALRQVKLLEDQLIALGEQSEANAAKRKELIQAIEVARREAQKSLSVCEKSGFELIEFEESVTKEKGCWLKFVKFPIPTNTQSNQPAKGAPPAKKGNPADDLKPIMARAWVPFDQLIIPGSTQLTQRVFLQTAAPVVKEVGTDGVEKFNDVQEYQNIFEDARTYVYFKIQTSKPVVPETPKQPEPVPEEILPVKKLVKWPFSKDPNDDFCKQCAIAVKALTREYYQMFQKELQHQSTIPMSQIETNTAYEARKREFLYEINTTGKYHIMKEKMKKTIVRIVREKFGKSESIKGLKKDERDNFYSELYVYLVQQMRETVQEMVRNERDELHLNVFVPVAQGERERDNLKEKYTNESLESRCKRLAYEEEFLNERPQDAEQYLQKLVQLKEGEPDMLWNLSQFYLRQGKLPQAEQTMRDCLSFDISNLKVMMAYSCLLCQLNRPLEAAVLFKYLLQRDYQPIKVNLLLSISYQMQNDNLMAQKFEAISNLSQLRSLNRVTESGVAQNNQIPKLSQFMQGLTPAPPNTGSDETNDVISVTAFQGKRLTEAEKDVVWIELAQSLLDERLTQFANSCLSNVKNQQTFEFLGCKAQMFMQSKHYEQALSTYQNLLDVNAKWICGYEQVGHCYYKLGQEPQAIQSYMKALRTANLTNQEVTDQLVYLRAGECYMKQEMYEDAKVMFLLCTQDFPTAYSYFNLGKASYHLDQTEEAEKVLGIANMMDTSLAAIWGYLTLVLLRKPKPMFNAAYQTMNESFRLGVNDISCVDEIVDLLLTLQQYKPAREALEYEMLAIGGAKNQKRLNTMFSEMVLRIKKHHQSKVINESLSENLQMFVMSQISSALNQQIQTQLQKYIMLMCGELQQGDRSYNPDP